MIDIHPVSSSQLQNKRQRPHGELNPNLPPNAFTAELTSKVVLTIALRGLYNLYSATVKGAEEGICHKQLLHCTQMCPGHFWVGY